MKYSFMSFSVPEATFDEFLALAVKYGYDGVEPRLVSGHAHGIEISAGKVERKSAREAAKKAGIAIGCIATSLKFAVPDEAAKTVSEAHEVIDLCGDLGCPTIRVFGGGYPDDVTQEQAADQAVRSFAEVADHASQRGVTLAFETHDSWTDPKAVLDVVKRVDKPSIQVNWDVMHPVRRSGYDMADAFNVLKGHIAHVHVHDGSLNPDKPEVLPMGTGQIDHAVAIGLLRDSGYKGFISGEWILSTLPADYPAEVHLPQEIKALRSYEESR